MTSAITSFSLYNSQRIDEPRKNDVMFSNIIICNNNIVSFENFSTHKKPVKEKSGCKQFP